MSWKNIKEHYRIGHIVQVRDGTICIGSGYCPELIMISPNGKVSLGVLGISSNDDLERYHAEMTADLGKLKELLDAPDTFEASLPVYTYDGGEILEKQCEAYGWPNITHDGMIQYENSFSADKAEVVEWAKHNAELGVKYGKEHVERDEKRLAESRERVATEESNLAKLRSDYPDRPEGLPNAALSGGDRDRQPDNSNENHEWKIELGAGPRREQWPCSALGAVLLL